MKTMYDDTTVDLLPAGGDAYACYVNGSYANADAVIKKFPKAKHVVITVQGDYRGAADCVDMETGDATVATATSWLKWKLGQPLRADGPTKPIVYCAASNAAAMLSSIKAAGIDRDKFWLWTAHYSGHAHTCDKACGYPVGADLTQWTDKSGGKSLDQSLVQDAVFAAPKPKVLPASGTFKVELSYDASKGRWATSKATGGKLAGKGKGGKRRALVTFQDHDGTVGVRRVPSLSQGLAKLFKIK